jgi:cyclopropane fatty-acyl-phospholipid synthase-like methyltransferase
LLADILAEDGFEMEIYDSFYETDKSVLSKKFDFIVSTEVVEHLSKPLEAFEKLFSMLKDNGVLAVMTQLYDDSIDFKTWYYKNDCTHICFFSMKTFDWLAKHLGLTYTQVENDIFVFTAK